MKADTFSVAAVVGLALAITLVALSVVRPRINRASDEEYGIEPVSILTIAPAGCLVAIVGLAISALAMASGWEPFSDARVALPWPYRTPDATRGVATLLLVLTVLVAAGGAILLARRTSPAIAVGTAACLLVLGLASANPLVLPIIVLLAVFEWGHSINRRSEVTPLNWLTIVAVGASWLAMILGALVVSDTAIAGVLLGFGVVGLVAVLVRVTYRAGPRLACETVACASLQAVLYSTGVLLAVILAAGILHKNTDEREDA